MTVEDLIRHLSAGNPKAEVVTFDHFGRPEPLDCYDFTFRHRVDGNYQTRPPSECCYLEVTTPDMGPEPD